MHGILVQIAILFRSRHTCSLSLSLSLFLSLSLSIYLSIYHSPPIATPNFSHVNRYAKTSYFFISFPILFTLLLLVLIFLLFLNPRDNFFFLPIPSLSHPLYRQSSPPTRYDYYLTTLAFHRTSSSSNSKNLVSRTATLLPLFFLSPLSCTTLILSLSSFYSPSFYTISNHTVLISLITLTLTLPPFFLHP